MRRLLSAALLSLAWIGFAVADDSAPFPAPPLPAEIRPLPKPLVPQPVPQLAGDVQFVAEAPAPQPIPVSTDHGAMPEMSKVEHLREAARHLQAAGYSEQSQKLERQADEIVESSASLLKQKRAALEQLQQEIMELEQSVGEQSLVVLRCRIVEFDRAAVKQLGFQQVLTHPIAAARAPLGLEGMLQALMKQQSAKVLAEPTIVTTSGRPASLRCGGEIPVILPAGGDTTSIRWRETGLSIEAVPICLGGNRLRLDLAAEIAEPDFTDTAVTVAGNVVPGMNVRRVNTQIEMKFGETKVIGGLISSHNTRGAGQGDGAWESQTGDAQEMELVVIVTAESARDASAVTPESDGPAVAPVP